MSQLENILVQSIKHSCWMYEILVKSRVLSGTANGSQRYVNLSD